MQTGYIVHLINDDTGELDLKVQVDAASTQHAWQLALESANELDGEHTYRGEVWDGADAIMLRQFGAHEYSAYDSNYDDESYDDDEHDEEEADE